MQPTRKPDFILKALNKKTDRRTGKIGAAWKNDDGSISICLDMMVSIIQDQDIVLTLFPNDSFDYRRKLKSDQKESSEILAATAVSKIVSSPERAVSKRKKKTMAELPVSMSNRVLR